MADEPIRILKGRSLLIPFGAAAAAILTLLGAGWKANDFLNAIQEENRATRRAVEQLHVEVQKSNAYIWSVSDMERWAFQLERGNRDSHLTVPDVREVHNKARAAE
jgi:hypothetical protein